MFQINLQSIRTSGNYGWVALSFVECQEVRSSGNWWLAQKRKKKVSLKFWRTSGISDWALGFGPEKLSSLFKWDELLLSFVECLGIGDWAFGPKSFFIFKKGWDNQGLEPDVNRTRNLLIWSQTRYHCATDPFGINWRQVIYIKDFIGT